MLAYLIGGIRDGEFFNVTPALRILRVSEKIEPYYTAPPLGYGGEINPDRSIKTEDYRLAIENGMYSTENNEPVLIYFADSITNDEAKAIMVKRALFT